MSLALEVGTERKVKHASGAYGALERSVGGTDLTLYPSVLSIDLHALERLLVHLMGDREATNSLGRADPAVLLGASHGPQQNQRGW